MEKTPAVPQSRIQEDRIGNRDSYMGPFCGGEGRLSGMDHPA